VDMWHGEENTHIFASLDGVDEIEGGDDKVLHNHCQCHTK